METTLRVLLIVAICFPAAFALTWWMDPTFKDWWGNRPTFKDPDRWERFKQQRRMDRGLTPNAGVTGSGEGQ